MRILYIIMKITTIIKLLIALVISLLVIYGLIALIKLFSPQGVFISLKQPSVVTQIKSLNRLETASFTIEKVIEAGTGGNAFQNILFGDKILLIAHGNIIAGFDLSKLQSSAVVIKGSSLYIELPAPEILVSSLDENQTKVYDRKLGLFTKGDPSLESKVRLAAENSMRQAACDGGILSIASDNARKQFQTTFITAGFKEVIIDIPVGKCN
ncbi:MAG: hypothetical protein UR31_C0011G0033 [Parcubacteria group bacterium GW2011_GWA2_33_14]|nr:MAG: hypothetical protein UR31_C0011G0033 [Parcubacteria group bacterium GW2011_GWA2_33_14]